MMRIKRPREPEEAEVIIIPMIDTMMFLLMVFIVASLTLAVQQGLPVNLPSAKSGVTHQTQNITLTVTADRKLYVNTAPTLLANETDALKALHVNEDSLVIINADLTVQHGLVVSVMDNARLAGVVHFAIATSS